MRALPKLDLNVTNRCNFHCIHCCFASGDRLLDDLPLEVIVLSLSDFTKLGGQRVDLTGGEPLIRHDIIEIIAAAKRLGLKVELITNGSLLSEKLLQQFKTLGLDQIAISLDGINYETYCQIRPVGKEIFNRVIENIQRATEAGFRVKINTVAFRDNLAELADITRFCIEIGAAEQGLYYFTPVGRGATVQEQMVDPVIWLDFIRRQLKSMAGQIKLSIETPILESEIAAKLETGCYLENPWHLQILPDGFVYPCCMMDFVGKPCGNIFQQSLAEIWEDPKLWDQTYFRENVEPLFRDCGSCVSFTESIRRLVESGKYRFVCPIRKYRLDDLSKGASDENR